MREHSVSSEYAAREGHTTDSSASFTRRRETFSSLKKSLSHVTNASGEDFGYFGQPQGFDNHERTYSRSSSTAFDHVDRPPVSMASDVALAALQYLPTPLLVLSSLKTIILANEAMGRLLGLRNHDSSGTSDSITDTLKGQTLSQIGIDMLSDGLAVWVSWEKFLDTLTADIDSSDESLPTIDSGDTTPTTAREPHSLSETTFRQPNGTDSRERSPSRHTTLIHDRIVDVIVSSSHLQWQAKQGSKSRALPKSPGMQTTCRMIISIWTQDDQRYFTLTFTSPSNSNHVNHGSHTRVVSRANSGTSGRSSRSSHARTSASSASSSVVQSPSEPSPSTARPHFIPAGAPARCPPPVTFTEFQKVTRMKDAMLKGMEIPVIAIWKDESVVFPNPAAQKLLAVAANPTTEQSYDFMARFNPMSPDFSRRLDARDNPILALCRTQKPFTRWQIGLIDERTGKRSNFDVSGHPVFDEKTGDFFAGLIAFKDVTEYTDMLASQTLQNEEQFSIVCDMMPQMIFITRPDGYVEYFSQRWYDYTGLTPQGSLGFEWATPFHKDDMPETSKRWAHSLATGDNYDIEYRCKRHDGEWRWFLGRAMPLRESKTGKILKWFGTCTDIQEIVDARETAARTRQQLVDVLHHTGVSMWTVDKHGVLTFFEGKYFKHTDNTDLGKELGKCIFDPDTDIWNDRFSKEIVDAVKTILQGNSQMQLHEVEQDGRWFRSKLVPLNGFGGMDEMNSVTSVEGVVAITTEVTQLRAKEQENIILLANEAAAKEASKMKSNFLANMSHEIRTPIAGVLGMSELLMDTKLDPEQSDFAQNIQRSANSLLTVINDILDFSKIESGKMLIEEVQFSLSVVLRDVTKMLSYAAQRKNLKFVSDIRLGDDPDLVLLSDPGRLRQILTNLLTNSIKFTSEGSVKLLAHIAGETADTMIIEFAVEDTGIGIEEDVKRRLFTPFSQADSSTARRFGGTGLGLTICKNLVDLMKGTISLESKLGVGTVAKFSIPFKKPEYTGSSSAPLVEISAFPDRVHSELSISTSENKPPRIATPITSSPQSVTSMKANRASMVSSVAASERLEDAIARESAHILVVEDNPVNQQIAIRFLKSLKFGVSAVWNGKEALEYLLRAAAAQNNAAEAQAHPLPSLILMDVQMPVLDGYDATHLIRHHEPYATIDSIGKIPIVAMTASAIQGDREKCKQAGMDDYLAKPVKRPVLEKMVLKWISSQRKAHQAQPSVEDTNPFPGCSSSHSASCTGHDHIALDWLSAQGYNDPALAKLGQRMPVPKQDKDAGDEEAKRANLSRSILASDVTGGDSEADRAMRRVDAEDKAQSLRDAKLLSATDGIHSASSPRESPPFLLRGANFADMTLQPSYPNQGVSESAVLALTKENIERFNHHLGYDGSTPTIDNRPDAMSGINRSTVPDGVPEIEMMDGDDQVQSSARAGPQEARLINSAKGESLSPNPRCVKRDVLGRFKINDRGRSEWSTSTTKNAL